MDQKAVRKLEEKLSEAIADVVRRLGMKHLPLLPSQHTMEMMAKATAVYEAAAENSQPHERPD